MKIKLWYNRSAVENADYYFKMAKRFEKKARGALEAIGMLQKRRKTEKKEKKELWKAKEWYENFPHFFTSKNGLLCIAGRNAGENELLYRKYLEDNDLWFHADIVGAATVILKEGATKSELEDRMEAASFSASYSKAWKNCYSSVDVYAVKKEQLYKEVQKAGAFGVRGVREWFKGSAVRLKAGISEGKPVLVPYRWKGSISKAVDVRPCGKLNKDVAASKIAKMLGADESYVKSILPSGKFALRKVE